MSPTRGALALGRARAVGRGARRLSGWSLRLALIALGVALVVFVVGRLWVIFLPVALALILATLLRPPTAWLSRHRFPTALAAITVVLATFALLGGLVVVLEPRIAGQLGPLGQQVLGGVGRIEAWLAGPPLHLGSGGGSATSALVGELQQRAATVFSTVLTAVSTVTSTVVTLLLTIVLTFLFIKDAPRFLPWVNRWVGPPLGPHLDALLTRSWVVLGSFVRTQALVGLIDAVLIGSALLALRVPLAIPLMVLIFFAEAFLPVLGAIAAGAVAVLVTLVSHGLTTAVIVLIVVVVVPQIEGNVLLPYLQGRSLGLHPAVVLLAVTAGGELFGVSGALLAVPLVAVTGEVFRYLNEQAEAHADEDVDGPAPARETRATPDGARPEAAPAGADDPAT